MAEPFNLAGEMTDFFNYTDTTQQVADFQANSIASFNIAVEANGNMSYEAVGTGVDFAGLPKASVDQVASPATPAANFEAYNMV